MYKYSEEPIIITNVDVPAVDYGARLWLPLLISGLAGTILSAFLPFVRTRFAIGGAQAETFTSWQVCEVSTVGFLFKFLLMVFAGLTIVAIYRQNKYLMMTAGAFWILHFLFCAMQVRKSWTLMSRHVLDSAGADSFRYSLGIGFYVHLLALGLLIAGTVFFARFCDTEEEKLRQ